VTPVLLGTVIGAVASGDVGTASGRVGAAPFAAVFVAPWLGAFPIAVGCFALALFAYLAAVYLALAAPDDPLREDFRTRALAAALAVFVAAAIALVLSRSAAPQVAAGIIGAPWAIPLHLCTAASGIVAIGALWRRRYGIARVGAAGQVTFILWGWAVAQYPFIVPMTLTIRKAAAPRTTLTLLLIGLAAGAMILIPSLRYLLRLFGAPMPGSLSGRPHSLNADERPDDAEAGGSFR
jgi:cytochrome d ubiquinol oxidase subunit II